MVTDAMIEAGWRLLPEHSIGMATVGKPQIADIYAAMHEARPTADLGEDGLAKLLLAAALANTRAGPDETLRCDVTEALAAINAVLREQDDRLILYREALAQIAAGQPRGAPEKWWFTLEEVRQYARDVLSRSA